ncbi:MAG: type II secretion system protein [Planctomycetia bacterium]|nr:type II secretion system protein [Planctomycetia bacterium]
MCLPNSHPRQFVRRALTLVELLIAMSIVGLMTAALGALAHAVKVSSDYTDGTTNATQQARVAFERISSAVNQGLASESFPGAIVYADTVGTWTYPDTLVVWHPTGAAANPTGMPQFNEIVVYCPNPAIPSQLLEITSPTDTRIVPPVTDWATWSTELTNLKTGATSQKVLITDLLRTAMPSSGTVARGAARFLVELHPTATDWANFRAGTLAFNNVPWVQSIYGSQTGLRQTWVRSELQLMPGYNLPSDPSGQVAIPFLGSATLYWNLHQ